MPLDFNQVIQQEEIVIVHFGTERCPTCHAIRRKIELWQKNYPHISYRYISIEENPEIPAQEGVFRAPTVFVYVEGKLTLRESGYFSVEQMLQKIERYEQLLSEE